jgi:hypothetical protein
VGRLLIVSIFALTVSFSAISATDIMSGLAENAEISGEKIIKYIKSGTSEYSSDPTIKACLEKMDTDKRTTVYALFNYIMYLDMQKKIGVIRGKNNLVQVKKMIKVSSYAKKAVNYCNG